jgi:Mrp family chromosome partitioning ATPase
MNSFLMILAESWRHRRAVGIPALLGALLAAWLAFTNPPQYAGRVLLQLQADAARAPLLQKISAPGHRQALWQALTAPDVLADSAPGARPPLTPRNIELRILNDYLLEIGINAPKPQGLAKMVDALGTNFIQALLAPERMRVEQLLSEAQGNLVQLEAQPLPLDATQAEARNQTIAAISQYQNDLRMLNSAFGQQGSQALLWFAESARVEEPLKGFPRWLLWLGFGAFIGGSLGWATYRWPRKWAPRIRTIAETQAAAGLPVVGILPLLHGLQVGPQGSVVDAGGKALNPADFGEIVRLSRAVLRNLRGPLVIVAAQGSEGASTLALLLAEKAAHEGKRTIVADLNLKNRTLSEKLLLGDGTWALPTGKGKWSALRPVGPTKASGGLSALAAPRHAATLQTLAEQGGLPALFEVLQAQAEVVIIDASPLAATNRGNVDAVTLGTHAGRVVLVAEADHTPTHALKAAADQLLLAGAPLTGVILNQHYTPSQRQLLGQLAETLGWVAPGLGTWLRKASLKANLE